MNKDCNRLNARDLDRREYGPGKHRDGNGLILDVNAKGRYYFFLRYMLSGRSRDLGLGTFPAISLGEARAAADQARELIARGIDPVDQAQAQRAQAAADRVASREIPTFAQAVDLYVNSYGKGWKTGGPGRYRQQFKRVLEMYAYPILGDLRIDMIKIGHVEAALAPVWKSSHYQAKAARTKIKAVCDWAEAKGLRSGSNPADPAKLKYILPQTKPYEVQHFRSLPYADAPALFAKLGASNAIGARIIELVMATGVRSTEAREARWAEFDLDRALWTIPAPRMKMGRAHIVALSPLALAILRRIREQPVTAAGAQSGLLFPNYDGKPRSPCIMRSILRWHGIAGTTHGFRSTFRTWAENMTLFKPSLCEMAIAHQIKDPTERAYLAKDIEARRALMNAWADFLSPPPAAAPADNVVPIRRQAEAA